MEVVQSYNLFVDSNSALSGTGDDLTVQVATAGIHADDGQFIRFSLESFSMYKNFYNVNNNNNLFRVIVDGAPDADITKNCFRIPQGNYLTIGDISLAFTTALISCLQGLTSYASKLTTLTSTTAKQLPSASILIDQPSDRLWGAELVYTGTLTSGIAIQSFFSDGDSYALAGIDRINSTDADRANNTEGAYKSLDYTSNSFKITTDIPSKLITILGIYPGQRSTEEHIYLRCDLPNNGIETTSMLSGIVNTKTQISSSDVFAKIPIDYEFCNYNTSSGREYILNIPNRQINTMRFKITDSRGRPIGRANGTNSSAYGNTITQIGNAGASQTSLGNLNCSFIVKVEVVQAYQVNVLRTDHPPVLYPKSMGVLKNLPGAY